MTTCFKCNGTGKIVAFSHIANGVCFQCGGTGRRSYQACRNADPHPELLVRDQERATLKQWDHLVALCGDDDRRICGVLKAAGAPMATLRYITIPVMGRAIALATAA